MKRLIAEGQDCRATQGRGGLLAAAMLVAAQLVAGADAVPPPQEGPAVRMRPYRVIAEWMEIQPLLKKDLIEAVQVVNLRQTSPAALAGVRNGMRILILQGIDVRGLTEQEFSRRLDALAPSEDLRLTVQGLLETREIVIPISRRMSVRPAASDTANLPPPAVAADVPSPSGPAAPAVAARVDPAPAVAPDPTGEATRKRLVALRKALDEEKVRAVAAARAKADAGQTRGFTVQFSQEMIGEASQIVSEAAAANLAVVCDAALEDAAQPGGASMFGSVLMDGINKRRDYSPDQKPIALKYLPRLPALIVTIDHMQWFEGADEAILAGWKKASRDERDGMLTFNSSRYAVIAAKRGITDALVALARTVRKPDAGKRSKGLLLREESAALKALVPFAGDNIAALADFVLKNKGRLVFDPANSIYVPR